MGVGSWNYPLPIKIFHVNLEGQKTIKIFSVYFVEEFRKLQFFPQTKIRRYMRSGQERGANRNMSFH